ncbi:MAG TPA: MGMT family protein, partial [Euryarchaeota archaeon]|nr:MGMT family protein [Euryarchaeota archaeon]
MDVYALIYDLVRQIPEGYVTTYGAIAKALGDIRASKAVGEVLAMNPTPIIVPCHRVVMSDGSLGGYT